MTNLIQTLSGSLSEKFKEVITPKENVYFCVEGASGNAIIGTDKKLVAITSGSFRGSIIYTYNYDRIVDMKINPPLHGTYITLNIVADGDDKELKPKLYFEPDQKNLLMEVLSMISSLSNTYTYKEVIKEALSHQGNIKLIVPMKNVLGEIFEETIQATEKVIICVSVGDNQGLVATDERVMIFKINDVDESYKVGSFPLDEIIGVEYSVGIVTGYLQIITPGDSVIKKRLREQELIDIDNIICFGKKNYGGLLEVVSEKLKEIIEANKKGITIKSSSEEEEVKNISSQKNENELHTSQDLEKIKKKSAEKKIKKSSQVYTDKNKNPFEAASSYEEILQKLSKGIIAEISSDKQNFSYSREIVSQISHEIVSGSFPELISSNVVELLTDRIMNNLPKEKLDKNKEKLFPQEEHNPEMRKVFFEPTGEEPAPLKKLPLKSPFLKEKLADITSLKNICAALLVDSKTGEIAGESIVEGKNYHKAAKIARGFFKVIKEQQILSKSIPQWLVEYRHGLVYLEYITRKYLLIIVGTENSNFGTLKIFIDKTKKELREQLI